MPSASGGPRSHPIWGEPREGRVRRLLRLVRERVAGSAPPPASGLRELPLALRRGNLAEAYLHAERSSAHPDAARAAVAAMNEAVAEQAWWRADVWAHRALFHFERAGLELEATRQARLIGDLRRMAGDPESSRRYYAEAIGEARDLGAEHEQGLASLGLGRSLMEMGRVTEARRLASAAIDLLDRAAAPAGDLDAARQLLGHEVAVGEPARGRG